MELEKTNSLLAA